MTDKPQGPGWGSVSDVATHAPDLQPPTEGAPSAEVTASTEGPPSMNVTLAAPAPMPVPELVQRPMWSGESDHRPDTGPMYPDLFEQAVSGSSLANVVTVNYSDGEARPSLDVPMPGAHASDHPDGDHDLVSSSARMPAEVGAFTGASAKKRWRILR